MAVHVLPAIGALVCLVEGGRAAGAPGCAAGRRGDVSSIAANRMREMPQKATEIVRAQCSCLTALA